MSGSSSRRRGQWTASTSVTSGATNSARRERGVRGDREREALMLPRLPLCLSLLSASPRPRCSTALIVPCGRTRTSRSRQSADSRRVGRHGRGSLQRYRTARSSLPRCAESLERPDATSPFATRRRHRPAPDCGRSPKKVSDDGSPAAIRHRKRTVSGERTDEQTSRRGRGAREGNDTKRQTSTNGSGKTSRAQGPGRQQRKQLQTRSRQLQARRMCKRGASAFPTPPFPHLRSSYLLLGRLHPSSPLL